MRPKQKAYTIIYKSQFYYYYYYYYYYCTHWGGKRCLQGFGWESEGKRPLGRPRRRWEDNIKMDLREIGIDGANWIGFSWLRIGSSGGIMNFRVP
jgi:hypothetical protein